MMELATIRHFLNLRSMQWKDRESIEAAQQEKLRALLSSARKTAFYQNLEDGIDLGSIPITEKTDVRSDADSFLCKGLDRKKLRKVQTSGSTGIPIAVYMDRESSLHRKVLLYFVATEQGRSLFDVMAAIESNSSAYETRAFSNFGLYRTFIFHSSTDEREILSTMRKNKANLLGSYPSFAEIMARANAEDPNPLKLKYVSCGGEPLLPHARALIKESFSCPVFDKYSCWEFGNIAWECPEEHSLHVNPGCIVETVDGRGLPKRSGPGELVITALHNRSMPLLRYRIGDIASWGRECPCGRGLPVLESVKGRSDDPIVLPSGKVRSAFCMNVSNIPGVISSTEMHQLVQEATDRFVFRYIPQGTGLDERTKAEIVEKILMAALGEKVTVEFEETDTIQRGKTGKLQRFISKVGGKA